MKTFADVETFRKESEAVHLAGEWLLAQRNGEVTSNAHMNLLAWTSDYPFHVLAVVLNLIDQVGNDTNTAEMIMLGPVQWLVENSPDDFTPILREAIARHAGFADNTHGHIGTYARHPKWARLVSPPTPGRRTNSHQPPS